MHCKEPEPYVITCTDGIIPYSETGGFNKTFRFKDDAPEKMKERSAVIQSQIEFDSYLDPTSFGNSPQIDFDSKTLLVGRRYNGQQPFVVSQEVTSDCGKKMIEYRVKLKSGSATVTGTAYYYAVIPKISDDTKVQFNVSLEL
ncbi:hypothetical protein [Dyadobacter luticola]|nr:hypothetical protein [Dyadobacter luticola]